MFQKLSIIKISNKKILYYIKQCNILGIIICLFSFLFTYYYFCILDKDIIHISFLLFELGLSIKIGGYISGIIINHYIK